MERGMREVALAEKFRGLGPAVPLGETGLAVRVPEEMALVAGDVGGPDGALLKQPKPLPEAGVVAAYYAWLRGETGPTPVYQLLFGFRSFAEAAAADPKAELLAAARRLFPDNPEAINWEEVSVSTPSGGNVVWDKLRIESRFEFVMYDVPRNAFAEMMYFDGAVEAYTRSVEGVGVVWIVWRIPAPTAKETGIDVKSQQVAGALDVAPQ